MVQIQFQLAILLKALFTKIFHVKIRLVKNLPYVTPYVTHGLAFQDTLKYSMLLLSLFSIGPVLCHVTFFLQRKKCYSAFFHWFTLRIGNGQPVAVRNIEHSDWLKGFSTGIHICFLIPSNYSFVLNGFCEFWWISVLLSVADLSVTYGFPQMYVTLTIWHFSKLLSFEAFNGTHAIHLNLIWLNGAIFSKIHDQLCLICFI